MGMKDFKGSKKFLKKAPPTALYSIYGKQRMEKRLQKDVLWSLIIKGGLTLIFMIIGLIIGSLPGLLIGAIIGFQAGKLALHLLKKRVKYFKKLFKKPLR